MLATSIVEDLSLGEKFSELEEKSNTIKRKATV